MNFSTVTFYFYFLPLLLLLLKLTTSNFKATNIFKLSVIASSLLFCGFENIAFIVPLVLTACLDLTWSHLMALLPRSGRRFILLISIFQNLFVLCSYKYLNWLHSMFPDVYAISAWHALLSDSQGLIRMPPGISFYIFESLSYTVDCYRRAIKPERRPLDFFFFIAMFPRFIAGPIVRYSEISECLKKFSGLSIASGLFIFSVGFILKSLLSDQLSVIDATFNHNELLLAWLGMFSYSLYLYIDFSAYSIMAIGIAVALGIPLLDNFREPYTTTSMKVFWRNWHISLSSWLRDYVYIPLGGTSDRKFITNTNLMITLTLSGLWHSASTTALLWGVFMGIVLVLENQFESYSSFVYSKIYVFFVCTLSFVLFRSNDMTEATAIYKSLLGLGHIRPDLFLHFFINNKMVVFAFLCSLVWVFILEPKIRFRRKNEHWSSLKIENVPGFLICLVFLLIIISLLMNRSSKVIDFIYFRF